MESHRERSAASCSWTSDPTVSARWRRASSRLAAWVDVWGELDRLAPRAAPCSQPVEWRLWRAGERAKFGACEAHFHDVNHALGWPAENERARETAWDWYQRFRAMRRPDRPRRKRPRTTSRLGGPSRILAIIARSIPAGTKLDPAVAASLAAALWPPRDPDTRGALRRLARGRGCPMERVFVETIEGALAMTLASADAPQRIRLGRRWLREWIGTEEGEVIVPPPPEPSMIVPRRDAEHWERWFRKELYAQCRAALVEPRRVPTAPTPPVELEVAPTWGDDAALLEDEAGERSDALALLGDASPRQREIAALLAEGYSCAEAARELGLSPATVRVQKMRLKKKLAASL